MSKKILSALLVALLVPNLGLAKFTDVVSHEYTNSINKLAEQGCIQGYPDNTFKPDNKINRAEALKLILTCIDIPNIYTEETFTIPAGATYSVDGKSVKVDKDSELKVRVPFNPKTYPSLEFKDINNDEWFIDILKEALVREIITGYADNTIKANQTVTKGEFFTMMYRVVPKDLKLSEVKEDAAKDAVIGQWFTESLSFAMQNKLIEADTDGNINPFRELNRGQVAHFLFLYQEWLSRRLSGHVSDLPSTPAPSPNEDEYIATNNDSDSSQDDKKKTIL